MAFKNEKIEINFIQAQRLLEEFNSDIDTHDTFIVNPENLFFFVYNLDLARGWI